MDIEGVNSTSVVVDEGELSTIGVEEDGCSLFRTIGVSSSDVMGFDDVTDDEVISGDVDGLEEMDVDEVE